MKQENAMCASEVKPVSNEHGKSSKEAMTGGVKKAVLGNRCGVASKVERGMDLISGMRTRFWPKKTGSGALYLN